ncbi:MAG: ArsR family transcriptional regulator [Phycisphaerales bacterium]|nr:ArsR family transcriptional regulator [Phycisphaerales bacterium]
MSENASNNIHIDPTLRTAQDRFIAAWGQMGSAWGISRTMAEVHALLYITSEPLCTDDVMDRLQISRGNASMSLRALQDWGIVTRTHKRGDRKEYFLTESDVWALFKAIARERKRRELDPVIASLFEIRDLTAKSATSPEVKLHHERLDAMLDFFTAIDRLAQQVFDPDGIGLKTAVGKLDDPT